MQNPHHTPCRPGSDRRAYGLCCHIGSQVKLGSREQGLLCVLGLGDGCMWSSAELDSCEHKAVTGGCFCPQLPEGTVPEGTGWALCQLALQRCPPEQFLGASMFKVSKTRAYLLPLFCTGSHTAQAAFLLTMQPSLASILPASAARVAVGKFQRYLKTQLPEVFHPEDAKNLRQLSTRDRREESLRLLSTHQRGGGSAQMGPCSPALILWGPGRWGAVN